jgi:ketosteroid isomerase-like protein
MITNIDQLLERWTGAERAGDAASLGELLVDDFVGIGPVGFVLDKGGWLGRFEHGLGYEQLALEEVLVRRHGDATIVVAHQHAVASHTGNPTPADLRLSCTVVDEGGALRIAAMQYSFIGAPPPGPAR